MSYNMADRPLTVKMAVTSEYPDLKGTISKENQDLNAASSSSRSLVDGIPNKRRTFKITSVRVNDTGDADSMDDLDESHTEMTEDYSSEFLDTSHATEYNEQETPSAEEDIPLNTNEMRDNKEKSDIHSRFRVVKIETKEPFRRGRWFCHDFLDPQQSVNVDRSDIKMNDDANSGSSSAGSSIHYVHGVDDPSKNPLLSGASGTIVQIPEGQVTGIQDMFLPIQPAPNTAVSQPSNPLSHVSQGNSTQCQNLDTSQSLTSIYSLATDTLNMNMINMVSSGQPMQGDIKSIQHSHVIGHTPLDSSNIGNVQQPGMFLPHFTTVPGPLQGTSLPMQTVFPPSNIQSSAIVSSDGANFTPGVHIHNVHLGNPLVSQNSQNEIGQNDGTKSSNILQPKQDIIKPKDLPVEGAEGNIDPSVSEADKELNVIQNPEALSPALVAAVGDLPSPAEEEKSGSSTVAIDNKIEQAMDLVKSHLMFAVREEVEVLKEQIAELIERNNQLEYENGILRAAASPETLAKLAQPRQQPPSSSSS